MRKLFLTLGAFIVPILFSNLSYAQNKPNHGTLFRTDTRPPSEIFSYGFLALGVNDDPKTHSRGISCQHGNATSAFISTTADPEYAANYARRLRTQTGQTVYVYIIDSQSNFFNMATTLRHINYLAGVNDALRQSEWIAYRHIPREAIIGVRAYEGSQTPAILHNPNHDANMHQVVQTGPYEPEISTRDHETEQIYAQLGPAIGLCESATNWCNRDSSMAPAGAIACRIKEKPENNSVILENYTLSSIGIFK